MHPAVSSGDLPPSALQLDSPVLQAWAAFPWLLSLARGSTPGSDAALRAFDAWMDAVASDPEALAPARARLLQWLGGSRHVGLLADLGLLTADGFGAEFRRRLLYKLLPEDVEPLQLRDWLRCLFGRVEVARWWAALPADRWLRLAGALGLLALDDDLRQRVREEWIESIKVLSARIAATGVDPLIARVYPDAQRSASAFLEQQVAVREYLQAWLAAWAQGEARPLEDDAPAQVLFEQCEDVIARIRRNTVRTGVTVRLTYRLQRLQDTLDRLRTLLATVEAGVDEATRVQRRVEFFRQQVAHCGEEASLRPLVRKGTQLAAREIISHAGRTGEHYAAATRAQWWQILRSAAIGGVVIALMAMMKIEVVQWHLPPLIEGLLVSLNYGLGFVLIHLLGGTVATKQPAMTAARIAAALGDPAQRSARVARENLVELSVQVMRGQWTAVLGNVGVALPLAALLAWLLLGPLGLPLAGEAKAQSLLHQLDPLGSTFLFAAIAGVCLFLSGVVAGYCDNLCVFHHLPRRLAHMPLLVRAAGRRRAGRIGAYVEHHFGALCGNFLFGLMLGGITLFGQLSGLPLDIRHVAFGSANLGVAGATLWGDVPGTALLIGLIGVAGIGLVNLAVSFSLSLLLALRAQQRRWSLLPEAAGAILTYLRRQPLAPFRLPPVLPTVPDEDVAPEPDAATPSPRAGDARPGA